MRPAYITAHFTYEEAACHSGVQVPPELRPNAERLATMLERIRATFGGALVPISWYRTPAWNERVGGAKLSQHMTGGAADIRPTQLGDLQGLLWSIDAMIERGELPELGGYGTYPAWIHLDLRTKAKGHIARWRGAGVGSEVA